MGNYVTVTDMRAEGVTDPPYTDTIVNSAIDFVEEQIERLCMQWFYPQNDLARVFDGNESKVMPLDIPLIGSPTEVAFKDGAGNFIPQNLDGFLFYNQYPYDRYYPRIRINDFSHVYINLNLRGRFPIGRRNIRVTGSWGFVEADGVSTPKAIVQATKLLVVDWLNPIGTGEAQQDIKSQWKKSENTDGHSYSLSTEQSVGNLTGNPIADRLIKQYVARTRMGTAQGRETNYYSYNYSSKF